MQWRMRQKSPANFNFRNGLENRYPSLGGSRVRIPPPPPNTYPGCEDGDVTTGGPHRSPRMAAVLRQTERVTPLELFFDLVFVLAITQCTALMAAEPTWTGMGKGLLVLGVLWWSWVGYAWLTSVVDPEEGVVRLAIFAAMAALLVAALCVPEAFGDSALLFACAYGVVRAGQITLFLVASRDDPSLRQSVVGLAGGTAIGVGLLLTASGFDGAIQGGLWALALLLDMGEPYLFGSEGWKLVPGHFAERHGLIFIIALGESIVAIGVGAGSDVGAGVVAAATLGIAAAAALWWLYFDVVALVAERRLSRATEGREQNDLARDSYSYLHFPMVAGVVLLALGMKKTLAGVDDPLEVVPATAALGGTAVYLLAHVAFRLRNLRTLNPQRLACAVLLVALLPVAVELPALATLGVLAGVLGVLVAYEAVRFSEARDRVRHQLAGEAATD
jgi:low temperature requirement protein LtrA